MRNEWHIENGLKGAADREEMQMKTLKKQSTHHMYSQRLMKNLDKHFHYFDEKKNKYVKVIPLR